MPVCYPSGKAGSQMSGELQHETIYESNLRPNPACARDVLAFVLTPVTAVTGVLDPEDFEAASEMLYEAKQEAVQQWIRLNKSR